MTQAAPEPVQARTWRVLAAVIVAAVALALAAVVVLYLARRQLAREAVTDWLRSRGVSAQASFQEIGPGQLVGALRIGPPDAPDLTVDRAEVDYSLAGLIAGRGVEVTSVRLTRPVLKASFRHGRFNAGALDRLIQEFRKRPLRPGAPAPRVEIDQGRIALTTDYGLLRVTADALIDKGRLVRLDADSAPVLVAREGMEAGLGTATLQARSVGDRLSVSLRAPVLRARTPKGEVESALLTLTSDSAYPDLTRPVVASGQANLELSAGTARLGGSTAQGLRVAATSAWRWTRSGGVDALAGDLQLSAGLQDLLASGLQLASASGDFQGRYALGAAPSLQLGGQAQMHGGWRGMGAPVRGDSRQIAALKRGLAAFHATAAGLTLAADARGVQARLTGAARLDPDRGGEIRLAPQGGGYRLTSSGGGLPQVQADIRRVAFANGAVTATGSVAAALSVGPLQQAKLRADGVL
ncbi:MAG: hypothetical protein KGO51_12000, partial [Alphaproteobacteria bacterium]|nr:hypothetical protein [Alphaproteobacteria bacterium]